MDSIMQLVAAAEREADSTFIVSAWYMPDDPRRAQVIIGFFPESRREEMVRFCEKYDPPPEMAFIQDITEFDVNMRKNLIHCQEQLDQMIQYECPVNLICDVKAQIRKCRILLGETDEQQDV